MPAPSSDGLFGLSVKDPENFKKSAFIRQARHFPARAAARQSRDAPQAAAGTD
jgi:hypothetical protein